MVKNRSNSSTCPVRFEALTLASQSRSQEIAARLSLPSDRSQQRFFALVIGDGAKLGPAGGPRYVASDECWLGKIDKRIPTD